MSMSIRLLLVVTLVTPLMSCASAYMKTTDSLAMPDANSAVVRFMRPGRFLGTARRFAILDAEKAICVLSNGAQFSYVTTPGKHLFITPGLGSEGPYFLEADLAERGTVMK